mmetsp:Transcript_11868/g.35517  ORF Transcript_11868/g.35517 Transcript_11868/m.35517 type:complete len:222 (-) Transcript_11868:514-1179(-)
MGLAPSKSKKGEITDQDRALLTLKTQRNKLGKEQKRLQGLVERETAAARALVTAHHKERALLALKRRTLHQQQLSRLDAWQLNVEQVMSTMETSKQQAQLLAALKAGSAAVAELQREVTLADVEALMDSSAEAQATQEAMQEALANTLTPEQDAGARAELEALQAQLDDEEALQLPAAPAARPAAQQADTADAAQGDEVPAVPTTKAAVRAKVPEEPMLAE